MTITSVSRIPQKHYLSLNVERAVHISLSVNVEQLYPRFRVTNFDNNKLRGFNIAAEKAFQPLPRLFSDDAESSSAHCCVHHDLEFSYTSLATNNIRLAAVRFISHERVENEQKKLTATSTTLLVWPFEQVITYVYYNLPIESASGSAERNQSNVSADGAKQFVHPFSNYMTIAHRRYASAYAVVSLTVTLLLNF